MQIGILVTVLSALAICGCSVDRRDLASISSPDNRLRATHIETMGGGAAGFVAEEIYLDEQNTPADRKHPILSASHCAVLSLGWLDDDTLQIHYSAPCSINQFTNRWYVPSDLAHGTGTPIEIILVREAPTAS